MEMRNLFLKRGPLYSKVAKSLAELCSCSHVLWNTELASDETGCLAEASSKQGVEGAVSSSDLQ